MSRAGSMGMVGLGLVGAALVFAAPLTERAVAASAPDPSPATTATAATHPGDPASANGSGAVAPTPARETWTVVASDPTSAAPTTRDLPPTPSSAATPRAGATTPATSTGAPLPSREKVAYLTFDDGPNPAHTPAVLRILDAYGAKATFFMVGEEATRFPALVRAVRDSGHAIGNHSYTHPWLSSLPEHKAYDEVARTNAAIGGRVTCLRPPGGLEGGPVKAVARKLGLTIQQWTVDTHDWKRPGAPAIVENALTPPDGGGAEPLVILLHDGGGDRGQTVAALPQVLAKLSARGYTFASLPTCTAP